MSNGKCGARFVYLKRGYAREADETIECFCERKPHVTGGHATKEYYESNHVQMADDAELHFKLAQDREVTQKRIADSLEGLLQLLKHKRVL